MKSVSMSCSRTVDLERRLVSLKELVDTAMEERENNLNRGQPAWRWAARRGEAHSFGIGFGTVSPWSAFKLASRSAAARDPAAREESHVSVTSLYLCLVSKPIAARDFCLVADLLGIPLVPRAEIRLRHVHSPDARSYNLPDVVRLLKSRLCHLLFPSLHWFAPRRLPYPLVKTGFEVNFQRSNPCGSRKKKIAIRISYRFEKQFVKFWWFTIKTDVRDRSK